MMSIRSIQCSIFSVQRGWLLCCIVPVLFLASCRTVPPRPLGEAEKIPAAFESSLPESFTAKQTLVFEFRPHWWWPTIRMTALGYAAVNRRTGDYAVVCLSPLGVKIFDIARTNGQTQAHIQLPLPGDREAFGKAIGEDIGHLYFNLIPGPGAEVRTKGKGLVFQRPGRHQDEHEFDSSGRLVRKVVWSGIHQSLLTFSDYRPEPGGLQPAIMTLENKRYRYKLTIRTL